MALIEEGEHRGAVCSTQQLYLILRHSSANKAGSMPVSVSTDALSRHRLDNSYKLISSRSWSTQTSQHKHFWTQHVRSSPYRCSPSPISHSCTKAHQIKKFQAQTPSPISHASFLQACLAAGAHLKGITHMDELAFSLNGENVHYGTPTNPACPDRIPGGSSSGSVSAVAAGDVDFAFGSDTGGRLVGPLT